MELQTSRVEGLATIDALESYDQKALDGNWHLDHQLVQGRAAKERHESRNVESTKDATDA